MLPVATSDGPVPPWFTIPYTWLCPIWYRFEFFRRNEQGKFIAFDHQPREKFLLPVRSANPEHRRTTVFAVKEQLTNEFVSAVSLFNLTKSKQKRLFVAGKNNTCRHLEVPVDFDTSLLKLRPGEGAYLADPPWGPAGRAVEGGQDPTYRRIITVY